MGSPLIHIQVSINSLYLHYRNFRKFPSVRSLTGIISIPLQNQHKNMAHISARQMMREHYSSTAPHRLDTLPDDVLGPIFKKLTIQDLLKCRQAGKLMRSRVSVLYASHVDQIIETASGGQPWNTVIPHNPSPVSSDSLSSSITMAAISFSKA